MYLQDGTDLLEDAVSRITRHYLKTLIATCAAKTLMTLTSAATRHVLHAIGVADLVTRLTDAIGSVKLTSRLNKTKQA